MSFRWANGEKKEQGDFGEAIDTIKIFDFPRLYIIDMRHLAEDIASACGASGPTDMLTSQEVFSSDGQDAVAGLVTDTQECINDFKNHFLDSATGKDGEPIGLIPRMQMKMSIGQVPDPISVPDIITKYNDFRTCIEDVIGKTCKYVMNPLNTSFRLLDDTDETPLSEYIDPEQQGMAKLINYDIVDELEFDDDLAGFPKITGAMEYASGIGDAAIIESGAKALIMITPRDCYDEILPPTLDLTDSIKIEFTNDETGSAKLVEPETGSGLFLKTEGSYTFAVSASSAGKVQIKATVCSVTIKAVTDRSLTLSTVGSPVDVDCIDGSAGVEDEASFAPGALTKVDRILTILFVPANTVSNNYGDKDRTNNELSATPNPQIFGTNLEN